MSITVTVENDTIKLPAGVHVPDGTQVELTLPAESASPAPRRSLAERYAGLIGITDQLPEDMAENHDHYLHGQTKKG